MQKKILVVDDDPQIRGFVAEILRLEGFEARTADGAEEALKLAEQSHFDAFLLDIDMPVINGISLCRMLRRVKEYQTTPILFVTGSETAVEEAFSAGCDDFIAKPVDRHVLRARLHAHLQRTEHASMLSTTRLMLDRYVSKRTREIAVHAAETGSVPEPKRANVVVLFTDIRGFTSLAEEISPDELFALVSMEIATQVDLVYHFGGYVDKFGGDGLMAVFDGEDMAVQSCLCAVEIIRQASRTAIGESRIRQLGIGIHVGPVVVGNIGSPEHLDYSVIGIAVNLAARLCGHATPTSIVVSKAVRDAVGADDRIVFEDERQAAVRGMKEPVTVYSILPHRE